MTQWFPKQVGNRNAVHGMMMTMSTPSSTRPAAEANVLGARVRKLRQGIGLTQADVAGADLSVAYISRIEAGQRRPERRTLQLMSYADTCARGPTWPSSPACCRS